VKRRESITLLGGAAAWPLVARAQPSATPVIGLVDPRSPEALGDRLRRFREGLRELGVAEGENVRIEYRWAENRMDRLPELTADLVRRQVAVIVTPGGLVSARVAKQSTTTIPVVFVVADDPVKLGLVTSLARPEGNLTGVNFFTGELTGKRLELLRELVPTANRIALLVNPANAANAETASNEAETAARAMGLQVQTLKASTSKEINAVFATFAAESPHAVLIGLDPFFNSRRNQLVHLSTRYGIPASYPARDYAEAGGLISYGANIADAWRQAGVYAGRILKGAKPADLPVVQSSKLELVINAETARMLNLAVPPTLLARADEVIE
jgi:putative ABC transport system substrate-binding protein